MTVLNVTVENKIATADNQIIVCDNTDYIVQFTLDAEWDDYDAKTMRILYSTGTYEDIVFTGTSCPLPRIYNAAAIGIGIYAGDLHATVAAVFNCKRSVLSEDGTPVDPPEDVYNQIMDAINSGMLKGETGNGIASISKTATSGNVDTYTILFTDGTETTYDVTNGAVTSVDGLTGDVELDYKANIDGYYAGLTSGTTEQVLSNVKATDAEPYVYRTAGGSLNIGDREEKTIVGASIVWSQLVDTNTSSVTIQSGHKYYAVIGGTASIGQSDGTAIAVTGGSDIVSDITIDFGSAIADRAYTLEQATAGSGVAWLQSYGFFTKPYYAYTASPSLQSVKTSAHETIDYNQWDEEWEIGTINQTTGQNGSGSVTLRAKNYIPIFPNTAYYRVSPLSLKAFWYDGNKNFIGYETIQNAFTTPTNASYMRFTLGSSTNPMTTYNNDICISLYWDGERAGEYEAYNKHSYALDSDLTLNGILKLDSNNEIYADGDKYHNDGTIDRNYADIDLGSLNWTKNSSYTDLFNSYDLTTIAKEIATARHICSKYDPVDSTTVITQDKSIAISANGKRIYVHDSAYTDAATFKTAMNGVKLIYEVATPTTETADPFQSPMIVDDWGTERFVDAEYEAGNRDFEMPVGHVTKYPINIRAKVETAPDSPNGDGDYIVRQTNGQNAYVPLEIPNELPTTPSEDGTYTLKVTVSDGVATYSWEA